MREQLTPFIQIQLSTETTDWLIPEDLSQLQRSNGELVISVLGQLKGDSGSLYEALDLQLAPQNCYALFREVRDAHLVHIVRGREEVSQSVSWGMPLALFVLTVFSVMYTGTLIAVGEIGLQDPAQAIAIAENLLPNLWRGLPYAISILLILGAHELGHYFMMRRYRTASSLPYFIPGIGISPFGTFGAVISLRQSMRNRRILFDVGVAGPLAGLVFAVPILLIGLATSPVMPVEGGIVEGNSVLYVLAKWLVFGQFLPNGEIDVLVNQLAWAGWTGLFVTSLNLIPLGQLDGGHVVYSLFGAWARRLYAPFLAILGFFTLFVSSAWLVLVLLLLFVGRFYAIPLDDITPLDPRRQQIALATLFLFGVIFVPVPLAETGVNSGLLAGLFSVIAFQTIPPMIRGRKPRNSVTLKGR